MPKTAQSVLVEGRELDLSNLDKPLWPGDDVTKADLIHYIFMVSHLLLPHLQNRPLTVTRYPDGIEGEWFYQKDCPDYAPEWIPTYPVVSNDNDKVTRYIVPNESATLVWLANQAAIELHPWMSRVDSPEHPDYAVIDLDPSDGATFEDVRLVAALVRDVLKYLGLQGFPKLSGATGIHVYVPLEPKYTYKITSGFAGYVGEFVVRAAPATATNERLVRNRADKVYVDHLQNLPGKTIVAAYCPRPRQGAHVSVPFLWNELEGIHPSQFTLKDLQGVLDRPTEFQSMYGLRQSIDHLLPEIERRL